MMQPWIDHDEGVRVIPHPDGSFEYQPLTERYRQMEHTPGPWHVGNGDVFAEGTKASGHDDIVICAIGQSGGFRSHEYAVVKAHKPQGRANARLIAAAPDLLAALIALLGDVNQSGLYRMEMADIIAARAAIAKATA